MNTPVAAAAASESSSFFDYRSLLPRNNNEILLDNNDNDNDNNEPCLPTLSFRERCLGCATCMVAGYLLSLGSFWRIKDLLLGKPLPFVINATVGNIIALMGSCFLSGPTTQYRRMCQEKRRMATYAYIGSLVMTLFMAFIYPWKFGKGLILLILLLIQYVAIFWYTLSYIPFAQDAVSGYVQRWTGRGDEY